ncbi:UDP-glucose 4-epimerase GalE [Clostridium sp. Marseille-P299]|uniref:UDP-glucose 4-epimerase GalE n=1 Tax=Clostridium sp. Marseille-P299 TaxID=1805477 RepID=UPI000832AC14|nr:UDP-glucose 4-epimerase GalE [Clostridium sp. Marseille-P299]
MNILVTGGAGYIGSHTCLELLTLGHEVIVVDNLSNSSNESLQRVEKLMNKSIIFYNIDMRDYNKLEKVFKEQEFDAVIHFAGLKAVGESVQFPLEYYENNIISTINLLKLMKKYSVFNLIFSSSATVYGKPKSVPINEEFALSTTNPYGSSKLFIEQILQDTFVSDNRFSIVILRYFNPIGAHESGEIGENPHGIPNNLLPYISQVAIGKTDFVRVFGNNYPTKDGTGVRDYIHVVDLAKGHIRALEKKANTHGVHIYNLGTGKGYSVLDVINAFSKACGKEIPYKIVGPRAGDIAECYSDSTKAFKELGWQATYDLEQMCIDAWNWQSKNPNGYN